MSQIKLTGKNVAELSTWFKRFSIIGTSLLFEIDTQTQEFIAKIYLEDRSLVKMSKMSFSELGLTLETPEITERVKIGLYNISKLNKIFDQFTGQEFEFTIKYVTALSDNNEEELSGLSILLKNNSLKVGLECSSLSIFKYVSDEKFENSISKLENIDLSFDLKKEDINQIINLCDLDKEYKKMYFISKNGSVYAKSKSFQLQIGLTDQKDFEFPILKSLFSKLDSDNFHVKIGGIRAVIESINNRSVTVIAILNENSYDTEKDLNLE